MGISPNNVQRFIDQHPSLFVVIFPLYFITLWFLVGAILSIIGGWFSLAKVYRTRVPFNGAKWRGQSGQMRWLTNYNRVLTLGTSQEGQTLLGGASRTSTKHTPTVSNCIPAT